MKPFIFGRANWFAFRKLNDVRLYIVQISDMDGATAFILGKDFTFEQAKGLAEAINESLDEYMKGTCDAHA